MCLSAFPEQTCSSVPAAHHPSGTGTCCRSEVGIDCVCPHPLQHSYSRQGGFGTGQQQPAQCSMPGAGHLRCRSKLDVQSFSSMVGTESPGGRRQLLRSTASHHSSNGATVQAKQPGVPSGGQGS